MNYLNKLYVRLQTSLQDEKGAAMAEYALLLALIAVVALIAVGTTGQGVSTKFTDVSNALK